MGVYTGIKIPTNPAGCKKWNEPQIRRFSRQGNVLNIPHSGEFSKDRFRPIPAVHRTRPVSLRCMSAFGP
jgi:hypothetical protein